MNDPEKVTQRTLICPFSEGWNKVTLNEMKRLKGNTLTEFTAQEMHCHKDDAQNKNLLIHRRVRHM